MKKLYPYGLFAQLALFMVISVLPLATRMYELNKWLYATITYAALGLIAITGTQIYRHYTKGAV